MLIEVPDRTIARAMALYANEPEVSKPRSPGEAIAGIITVVHGLLSAQWPRPTKIQARFDAAYERVKKISPVSERAFREALLDLGLAAAEDVLP
jgi:hypothetical protein